VGRSRRSCPWRPRVRANCGLSTVLFWTLPCYDAEPKGEGDVASETSHIPMHLSPYLASPNGRLAPLTVPSHGSERGASTGVLSHTAGCRHFADVSNS